MQIKYWFGQKVHLSFSVTCYEKPKQTFWSTWYIQKLSTFHEFTAKPLDSNHHHFLGAATVISSLVSLIHPCISLQNTPHTAIRLILWACNITEHFSTHSFQWLPLLTHSKKLKSLHQPRRPFLIWPVIAFSQDLPLCFLTLHQTFLFFHHPTRLAPSSEPWLVVPLPGTCISKIATQLALLYPPGFSSNVEGVPHSSTKNNPLLVFSVSLFWFTSFHGTYYHPIFSTIHTYTHIHTQTQRFTPQFPEAA